MNLNFFFLLVIIILFNTCTNRILKNNETIRSEFVKLNDSVFISKYEVSNLNYKLFLKDAKRNRSKNEYDLLQLDSISLRYIEDANTFIKMPFYPGYFKHPSYDYYPVVGISYAQAKKYCTWLTAQQKGNKNDQIKYRLPTIQEWETLSKGERFLVNKKFKQRQEFWMNIKEKDSLKISGKIYKTNFNVYNKTKFINKGKIISLKKVIPEKMLGPQPQPTSIYDYIMNEKKVFHLFDNVSEMTEKEGISKGANFLSSDLKNPNIEIEYEQPEPWLGFRIVREIIKR